MRPKLFRFKQHIFFFKLCFIKHANKRSMHYFFVFEIENEKAKNEKG